MDAASHVLSQVVGVLEVAVAVGAMEMLVVAFVILVVVTGLLRAKGKVASLAVVGIRPVILGSHVVISGSLGPETRAASITFVWPLPVIQSIHMLGTSLPGVEAASAGITLKAGHGVLGLEMEEVDVTDRAMRIRELCGYGFEVERKEKRGRETCQKSVTNGAKSLSANGHGSTGV